MGGAAKPVGMSGPGFLAGEIPPDRSGSGIAMSQAAREAMKKRREAEEAARVGHLEAQVRVPGHAATAIPLWDELRIWDPGD